MLQAAEHYWKLSLEPWLNEYQRFYYERAMYLYLMRHVGMIA